MEEIGMKKARKGHPDSAYGALPGRGSCIFLQNSNEHSPGLSKSLGLLRSSSSIALSAYSAANNQAVPHQGYPCKDSSAVVGRGSQCVECLLLS
jgi:hypothetical protein